jgi:enoyl-CoA hydratase
MNSIQLDIEKHWATLTVSKPQALNALSSGVLDEMQQALNELQDHKSLRCLIVTGDGDKAFVAGADIKEINALTSQAAFEFAGFGQKVFSNFEKLPIPVIAAVNGFALGGGLELALSCDFIFASTKAKFGLPECTLGLMPGFGGTVRLARKIGPSRAMQLTVTGDMIGAEEALDWGLVNEICEPDQLLERAKMVATTIASRAPLAVASIKKTIQNTYGVHIIDALNMEQKEFGDLFTTKDCKEGTTAFIEKRKPNFTGQ